MYIVWLHCVLVADCWARACRLLSAFVRKWHFRTTRPACSSRCQACRTPPGNCRSASTYNLACSAQNTFDYTMRKALLIWLKQADIRLPVLTKPKLHQSEDGVAVSGQCISGFAITAAWAGFVTMDVCHILDRPQPEAWCQYHVYS